MVGIRRVRTIEASAFLEEGDLAQAQGAGSDVSDSGLRAEMMQEQVKFWMDYCARR
jgi:hypothetical protein